MGEDIFGIKDNGVAQETADLNANTKATDANTKAKAKNAKTALARNKKLNAPATDSGSGDGKTGAKDRFSGKTSLPTLGVTKRLVTTYSITKTSWKPLMEQTPRPLRYIQGKSLPFESSRMPSRTCRRRPAAPVS